MAQDSGPRAFGSLLQRQFTPPQYLSINGDRTGVVQDFDGTAYAVTALPGTDTVQVGSSSQDSVSVVAGHGHRVPVGQPEVLTIPAATSGVTTHVVAVRYDPARTVLPGPCYLVVFPAATGTGGFMPDPSAFGAGVVHLPLWTITRQPNQPIEQAVVRSVRSWLTTEVTLDATSEAPARVPIGGVLRQGKTIRQRVIASGVPAWIDPSPEQLSPLFVDGTISANATFNNTTVLPVGPFTVPRDTNVLITVYATLTNPSGQRVTGNIMVAGQFLTPQHSGEVISSGTLIAAAVYTARAGSNYIDLRALPNAGQTVQVNRISAVVVPT